MLSEMSINLYLALYIILREMESPYFKKARKSVFGSSEMNTAKKEVNPEYFFVAALSLYKNVTDAKLASCIAARNLAKHRRFYKGSLRNIPG